MPHLSWRSQFITVILCTLILPVANAQLTQVGGNPGAVEEDSPADQIGEVNMAHGKLAPPIIPGAPEGAMKFFEGVWDIELENEHGTLNMVAVLSKGLNVIGQRTPNADWSITGVTFRPTDGGESHVLIGFNGKIEYISASAMQVKSNFIPFLPDLKVAKVSMGPSTTSTTAISISGSFTPPS